jgi:hypothetical protein
METLRFTDPITLRYPAGGSLETPADVIAWLDAAGTEFSLKRAFHVLRVRLDEAAQHGNQQEADAIREQLVSALNELRLAR